MKLTALFPVVVLVSAAGFVRVDAAFSQTAVGDVPPTVQESAPPAATPETGFPQQPNQPETAAQTPAGPPPDAPQWPQDADGWYLVTPDGAAASFAMPVSPQPSERQMVPVEGTPIHVRMMAAVDERQVNYVFAWHDQAAPRTATDIKNTLEGAVKGALGSTLGQLESAEPLHVGEFPGCDFRIVFTYKDRPMRVAGRVILVGPRVYQLTCVIPDKVDAEAAIARFAGSFVHVPVPAADPSAVPATAPSATGSGPIVDPATTPTGG